ncbi:MAG: class I SAM-dependent methyltransferase [Flavobacteriales bacterium]|nr:class I SAM-dependent methyltransferase [Flavobacteriales bacterium]
MIQSFFSSLFGKKKFGPPPQLLADQLRKPHGLLGKRVANKLNETNRFLYHFVLSNNEWKDGFEVLEIGFGNGKLFPTLFAKAKNLRITGLDFSEKMTQSARRENRAQVQSGQLEIFDGASDHMPFADGSFDFVFCINVIYFWENPDKHLAEIKRVLKPSGVFCTGMRPQASMEKLPFTQFGFHLYTAEEWQSVLMRNGFHISKCIHADEPPIALYDQQLKIESLCINTTII